MALLILGLVLALFGGIIPAIKDWKAKTEINHTRSNLLAALGFFILCIGTGQSFYSGWSAIHEKNVSDSIAKAKDSQYTQLLNKNLTTAFSTFQLQQKSLDTTIKVLDTTKQVLKQQLTLASLQNIALAKLSKQTDSTSKVLSYGRQTIKYILGDSSFPIMNAGVQTNSDVIYITYLTKSDIPIYDLKIVMPTVSNTNDSFINLLPYKDINVGTLTKNYMQTVFERHFPSKDTLLGLTPIGTVWRTGYYTSYVYFRKGKNGNISVETHHYNGKGEFKFN